MATALRVDSPPARRRRNAPESRPKVSTLLGELIRLAITLDTPVRSEEDRVSIIREARSIVRRISEISSIEVQRDASAVRESRAIRMSASTDAEGFSEVLVTGSPILAAHSDKLHLALAGKATAQETVHAVRALALALLRDTEPGR